MNQSLVFLTIGFTTAIVFYAMTIAVELFSVIPLQIKEAGVKNGLQKLRKKLLIKGVILIFIAATSILALLGRFIVGPAEAARWFIVSMVIINSAGILVKSLLDYLIYHEQYTPEAKRVHELVDEAEKNGTNLTHASIKVEKND